jgi:hypothetical protein
MRILLWVQWVRVGGALARHRRPRNKQNEQHKGDRSKMPPTTADLEQHEHDRHDDEDATIPLTM